MISGVGHEVDFTIADFAADVRAPTPSAAAELAVPDAREWLRTLRDLALRLRRSMLTRLADRRQRLQWLTGRAALASPTARLAQQAQRLDEFEHRLGRAWRHGVADRRTALGGVTTRLWVASPASRVRDACARHAALGARLRVAALACLGRASERLPPLLRTLHAVSPLATLERGYAIVSDEAGRILRRAADAAPGSLIEARLASGRIRARVDPGLEEP